MWQQSGRAGRREKASLSVYVAFSGPLDQHFMKAPQKLFMEPIENAQVDASNRQVYILFFLFLSHLASVTSSIHECCGVVQTYVSGNLEGPSFFSCTSSVWSQTFSSLR